MDAQSTPITAYKFLLWGGKSFYSPLQDYDWLPGWNVIRNGPLDLGEFGRNGFYTFKNEPTELGLYPCVVELEIAGHIVECQSGYRSEFARIKRVVNWQIGYEFYANFSYINQLHGENHSTEKCKSVWPMMTPYTRVYQLPDKSKVAAYHIPIAPELSIKGTWTQEDDGSISVPYSVLTINLDHAHFDNNGYYQYGYNAEHDVLVYRKLEE